MLLTDPLDSEAVAVLRLVQCGYRAPSGHHGEQWPTWQWVRWQADRQGLDAELVLRRLPAWQNGYRPFRTDDMGGVLQPDKPIELTVHGLVAVGENELVPVFLAALEVAAEHQDSVEPDPHALTPLALNGDLLTNRVEQRSERRPLEPSVVRAVLLREPATWVGHFADPSTWVWDLTHAPLRRFLGVKTAEEYLQRLDDLIGVRPAAAAAVPLPPLALLDALDHLDAEWTLRTGQRLLAPHRLARPAQLSQPVTSGAEFEAACSSLDDLFKQMRPRPVPAHKDEGTLAQLDRRLAELLPGQAASRAAGAIGVLRQLNALRVGQQHSGTKPYQRLQQARRALGLADPPGDWSGDWHRLQHAVLGALRVLREEIAVASAGEA
jgi:hypothetical protein